MAAADLESHFRFGGEVNIVTGHFFETVLANGIEETRGRAVIEDFGWLLRRILEIDFDGVALAGADALAVVAESETFFVAGGDDVIELIAGERRSVLIDGGEEMIDTDPAGFAEFEADAFGFVAQNQAEEFAGSSFFFVSHIEIFSRAASQSAGMLSRPALRATIPPTMAAFVSQSPPT